MISGEFLIVSEIEGKKYVPYSSYIDLQLGYERDAEKRNEEIESLKIQSFHDNDTIEKFQKDFARFNEKNKALEDENNALKEEIQRLMGECGENLKDTKTDFSINDAPDYKKLCRELQDQHQQDCILINNLNVTIDKLVDRYANLRKNVGMD